VRDRQDAGAADQPDGGLDGDEAVLAGGVQKRAGRFGADGGRAQTGRHDNTGTRARAAREHDRDAAIVQKRRRIGVLHLTAQRRIARGHVDREDVGELGQVHLAQDHRAGVAQQFDDGGVVPGARTLQRQRARRGRLAVTGCDVVLHQDRDAGKRSLGRRLRVVELACDRERVGVELAHGVEPWPTAVVRLDAREIAFGQRRRSGLPAGQRFDDIAE
jgi:hypothetical protein